MTTSTSFAQVANNQSISLLSALRANTPPTKGQTTSRKFLTLSIFFLLSFFCTTNLWGADVVYKTAKFGSSYNSAKVSSYTSSWYSTYNGFRVDVVNANNNNNGWSFIKMGRESAASTGTITTNAKIDAAITKVTLTIDAITVKNITSITLKTATSSNGTYTSAGTFTKATGAQTVTLASPTANLFYKIEVVCTKGSSNGLIQISQVDYYKSNAAAAPKYTVTLVPGSGSVTDTELEEPNAGDGVTLPTPTLSSACQSEDWSFAGWAIASVDTETETEPTLIAAGKYMPSDDITLYAVYQRTEETEGGGSTTTVVDNLTHSINGKENTNTGYVKFSGKSYTSNAVYAGNTTNGNNSNIKGVIQIRSDKSTAGIVTTTSGGKAKKVTVVWYSSTADGRTLDIYGKNSAYSAATDLYNGSNQGTKLGSIVKGTSTELTITGDYEYIGLRSNSGAMYLTSISIDWTTTTGGGSTKTTYYHSTPDCAGPCASLAAPSVTATNITSNSFTLSWNAVDGATSYNVYNYTTEDMYETTSTSYTFSGLDANTTYEWVIEAAKGTCYKSTNGTTTTLTACEKLGNATGLQVETNYVQDGKTYVKFSWTPANNTKNNAVSQKLCFGKVGEAGTCVDDLEKNLTWTGDLASKLSAGEYWWSIQALGDGTDYCDGDVVKGSNFTIYSITYNTNGGNTITATSGTALPAELPTPIKTGYTFVGWYTDSEFNTPATAGDAITQNTTLHAKWTINQYTVTLNPNYPTGKTGTFKDKGGNTISGNLVLTYDYNTASMSLIDLYQSIELEGYQFNGWYSATSGGSKWTSTGEITKDVTVYAQWSKLYTITLSENGTETTLTPQTSTSYTLPDYLTAGSCQDDTKEFVGWTTTSNLKSAEEPTTDYYAKGEIVTLSADETFYAVFATAEGVPSTDYAKITNINNLTDGKYVIAYGYNTTTPSIILKAATKDATKLVATSASPSSDKYQNPAAENIWSIKKNGTTYTLYNDATSKYVQANTTPALLLADANPTNFNIEYSTDHWKIKINGNTSYQLVGYTNASGNYFQTKLEANASYKIQLYKNTSTVSYSDYTTTCDATKATVTYDLNGGTGATCEQTTVTKDEAFNLCSSTPTKNGYTFAGWSDGTKTYEAGAEVTISESTTFYASWKANIITITWDLNYTDCPESETSTYIYDGEDIEMPEDPIRTGYKFNGWYTESTDGNKVTEVGETNKPSSDVTYYAHWLEQYTVTFYASGQVYQTQQYKYTSGDKLVLPETDPSAANFACDGYLFEGWSKYQQTKEDANRPELVDANTSVENDLELHAVWKKASTSGAGTQIFYESFDTENGTGGNDGKWSGDIAKNSKVNTTWTFENEGGADQCIKLGSGSKKGSATTPALTQLSGDATLSFKAAAWNSNSESTTLKLTISGGGTLTPTSVTLVKGAWTTYEVQITDGTPSSTITFAAANASNNRFFLDEVIITTSGSYNYTTVPNCGPTMVAKENVWVTSANGQSVKVNVPLGIKLFEGNATITGTSTNENFVVNTLENAGNGEHQVVVVYTPTADDTKENTTITLTAKNGEDTWATTTFVLNGRSLPNEFVVVANKGDKNYALPANMTEAGTYAGLVVEVNGEEVTAAPKSHLYNLCAVHSTRYGENGTAVRLVGNNDACLWASNAVSGTSIRNWAKLENANTANYEWYLYTEDGDTYYISSTAVTEEGRVLRLYGNNFGMYKEGVNTFRFFPVGCTSTPMNVQTSTTRTSATISWTNASECNVVVKQGSTTVQSISAAASPVVVSNLAESTAYTFTLTPADNESCVASGAFTTTGPTIDIVEWETNGILIQVDKDNELNPKVVIKGEEEHGNVGGNVADELFFSKYFEAHAENKLLAIFNGTTATIDLTGYTIKSENGTLDLSQFGQTKGKVASNEEIILVYYDANYSAEKCAEEQQGYENWNILTEKSVLAFSGRGSIGLYKNDVLIDVIGSTFPSGELTKIGKSDQGCGTEDDVRLHIDGNSVNDESSFFCFNGDNIKTDNVETDYALSTNRCLLIRKNTVTSGANAVATNKATVDATCGELSSTFATLCSEWSGFRIGSGKSSTDEIKNATCDGLGYVGGFDYNNYYRTLETLDNSKTLNEYTRNADENTYFIVIEDLAQYSCLNIQLQLTDNVGNVLTEQTSQVPILVAGEKSTTDEIFSAIVKDSETSEPDYETSKIRCSTCDVVILKNATLTKADAETVKDVNQVRDIYIYPGGKLVVPANATDYSVNNVSLRRVQDEVAAADIQAPLNITSSSKAPIFVDVRIDANNWHWFALPYDCNIADVTWADGSKAAYNTDWFLMYYDGESRAASTNPYDNHWKVYNGTKIEAGKGYIVGITGDISKPAVKFELRFPMAQKVLTAEQTDKTVPVNAWGVKSDNKPNNLGWNLVGNPYLNYYKTADEYSLLAGLPLIKYTSSDLVVGEFYEEEKGNIPFLVTPIDGGWYEYRQELASEVNMMPFTAYFVQVGDPNTHENGHALNASFEASNRGKRSIVRRAPREVEEIEEPIIVRVELTNSKGESDKTSLVIDQRFTNEYEMNGDFFKWFGDYYNYYTKPVLYTIGADQGKRAFNALNEELAKQPIPVGMYAAQAGNYTFSLNQQFDLSRVEEVWLYDATQSTYTNLMQSDYTFSTSKVNGAGRFSLSVKLAPKVATGMENVNADKVWATTQNQQIIVNGLENNTQLWMYDAAGKLLYTEVTSNYQHRYSVPQVGTYFIALQKGTTKQTIKVVVE